MSVTAELVNNYAEIRRKFRNLKPPVKVTPMPETNPNLSPVVNLWTHVLQKHMDETAAFGPVVHPSHRPRAITWNEVLNETCRYFEISQAEILAPRRMTAIVYPRQVLMYMATKHCTRLSLPQIGRKLDKDHTTVMSGRDKIRGLLAAGHQETIEAVKAISVEIGA